MSGSLDGFRCQVRLIVYRMCRSEWLDGRISVLDRRIDAMVSELRFHPRSLVPSSLFLQSSADRYSMWRRPWRTVDRTGNSEIVLDPVRRSYDQIRRPCSVWIFSSVLPFHESFESNQINSGRRNKEPAGALPHLSKAGSRNDAIVRGLITGSAVSRSDGIQRDTCGATKSKTEESMHCNLPT
jgi:hypothetical protein